MTVIRTEKFVITRNNQNYIEIDEMAFRCKNLYNSILYQLRTLYFSIEKDKPPSMKNYDHWTVLATNNKGTDEFIKIGNAKVAQLIVKSAWNDFNNFSKAYWAFVKNPKNFKARPKLPRYKDSVYGRCSILFNSQAISSKSLKSGVITPSQLSITLSFRHQHGKVKEVRITPRNNYYVVNVVYEKELDTSKFVDGLDSAAIDLGVSNLAALVSTNGLSKLYDGSKVKDINQQYNDLIAKAKSELPNGVYTSNKIRNLWKRREFKLKHELHCISKAIVEDMCSNNIFELYVGKNDNWKQNVNLGKKNNREFVSIPFNDFIFMLQYKSEEYGIEVNEISEAYTSKASSIDKDHLPTSFGDYQFSGCRKTRSIYVSKDGTECNADSNAAINILRKTVTQVGSRNDYEAWVRGCVVSPVKVKVN